MNFIVSASTLYTIYMFIFLMLGDILSSIIFKKIDNDDTNNQLSIKDKEKRTKKNRNKVIIFTFWLIVITIPFAYIAKVGQLNSKTTMIDTIIGIVVYVFAFMLFKQIKKMNM